MAAPLLAASLLLGQAKQPQPKSQKEGEAINAIFMAQDPDARIAAAENLLQKFADTEFKAIALQVAAMSAQQKGDFEKMVIYSERTLESDPKNYAAMLILAGGLAQRTREFDLDKEEKLGRAEKMAKEAIDLAKAAAKPNPQITDEQWETARKDQIAQGHEALGMIASTRKKYDVAVTHYNESISTAAQQEPATYVRLAAAYNQLGKPDEAVATLDKLNAVGTLHPQVKAIADEERKNAAKIKAGGKPAAASPSGTAPAPAQVEIKK